MPARVTWYEPEHIILCVAVDPLTLDDLEYFSTEVWALAAGVPGMVDLIFDYGGVTEFPRGGLPIIREGGFKLPTLERVALVGNEPLMEMTFTTLTHSTYRPDPTVHATVQDAASYLRRMASEDNNRD